MGKLPSISEQVKDAIRRGNKVEAIQIYRADQNNKPGLKEAKDIIDAYIDKHKRGENI
jgi:ribosomal protein L7/L12